MIDSVQVDMKIIFYELIRMLMDYERSEAQDVFDDTRTIHKIEGYQELTNKLQRHLSHSFTVDLKELKNLNLKGINAENKKNEYLQLEEK